MKNTKNIISPFFQNIKIGNQTIYIYYQDNNVGVMGFGPGPLASRPSTTKGYN